MNCGLLIVICLDNIKCDTQIGTVPVFWDLLILAAPVNPVEASLLLVKSSQPTDMFN